MIIINFYYVVLLMDYEGQRKYLHAKHIFQPEAAHEICSL